MSSTRYTRLLCSAAVIALASGTAAYADDANFNIQPQSLNTALNAFSEQSAHPVLFKSPEGITITTPTQTEILVSGTDKQQVGEVAAKIRGFRPPEPYKGKGVKYAGENIIRKEAKKA